MNTNPSIPDPISKDEEIINQQKSGPDIQLKNQEVKEAQPEQENNLLNLSEEKKKELIQVLEKALVNMENVFEHKSETEEIKEPSQSSLPSQSNNIFETSMPMNFQSPNKPNDHPIEIAVPLDIDQGIVIKDEVQNHDEQDIKFTKSVDSSQELKDRLENHWKMEAEMDKRKEQKVEMILTKEERERKKERIEEIRVQG